MSSNPAFAFVVNSLLNSNKNNSKILSKAKKEYEVKEKVTTKEIELVQEDGQAVKTEDDAEKPAEQPKSKVKRNKSNRFEIDSINRVKPKPEDKERERMLTKIATKGVVQLFNVVREQQKDIKHKLEEAGPSERKKAKVLSEFTEVDMISKVNEKAKKSEKTKSTKAKKWKVLSDDFMTGAKFKDWDKESNSDDD